MTPRRVQLLYPEFYFEPHYWQYLIYILKMVKKVMVSVLRKKESEHLKSWNFYTGINHIIYLKLIADNRYLTVFSFLI